MPPDPLAIACFAQHSYSVCSYILASNPADLPDQCKTASSTPPRPGKCRTVCIQYAIWQIQIQTPAIWIVISP